MIVSVLKVEEEQRCGNFAESAAGDLIGGQIGEEEQSFGNLPESAAGVI